MFRVPTWAVMVHDYTMATVGAQRLWPGLAIVTGATIVAALLGSVVPAVSTLTAAVLIGAFIGNVGGVTPAMAPGLRFAAKHLLRLGVVLLGLRLSLGDVARLGAPLLCVVIGTVVATFFGTQFVGRRLGLSKDLSLLVATGFSICGASAIAAMDGAGDAEEEEVAAAIGLVTLYGSLAIVVLPLLSNPLGLTNDAFGTWVGASVHDVAQVVATASTKGPAVAAVAVVVKLTRVALLAPIVTLTNVYKRQTQTGRPSSSRQPLLPSFVVGFLVLMAVRTTGVVPSAAAAYVQTVEQWLLAAALVGLGSGVRLARFRSLGLRPVGLGAIAWALVASVSYAGVIGLQQ